MLANKYSKFYLLFFCFILSIFTSYSATFNACNVQINDPQFEIKTSSGSSVLIVDNQGDVFLQGRDHSSNNQDTYESIEIDSMHFNEQTSKFSSFSQNSNSFATTNALLVKDFSNQTVASLSGDSIVSKGSGIYQDSQAQCLSDGYYCSGSVRENRDYYCNIDGEKSGSCEYNVLSSENCLTKSTYETDSGVDYTNSGYIRDFVGCSGGNCDYNQYSDVCESSDSLKEYSASGSSYNTNSKSCSDYDYRYCVGDSKVNKKSYSCSGGECGLESISLVRYCSSSPTSYSSWSCVDDDTRERTVTTYSSTCSSGSCGQSSSTSTQTQSCGSNEECSGGSCNICTSQASSQCSAGNAYWYDSCGNKGSLKDSCGSNEACSSGSCYSTCTSQDSYSCNSGDVYWYNSCGDRGSLKESCSIGCSASSCEDYTYSWDEGSWGSCSANPTWDRSCTSRDPKTGCTSYSYSCVDQDGYKYRDVDCVNDQTGDVVGDSYCSSPKPSTGDSCSKFCSEPKPSPSPDPKYGSPDPKYG